MPNAKFDAKSFNPEAFKYIMDRIPRTRLNEIRKSKVLVGNPDIRAVLGTQNGTGYARVAVRGLLDGEAVNYDGQTDITATSTKTFEQGVVVIGRAKAWVEKDFSFDITGGVDFMNNVAQQVADYWQDIDQDTILAVLKGVFSMTGGKSGEFVTKHTYYHYEERGWITLHGLENVNAMYKEYHALGGNGTVTALVNTIHEFEVRDDKRPASQA